MEYLEAAYQNNTTSMLNFYYGNELWGYHTAIIPWLVISSYSKGNNRLTSL